MSTITLDLIPALAEAPEPNESCDKCSAHALVRVEGTFGALVFCLHHLNEAGKSDIFMAQVTSRSIISMLR
jgi:hypothetical protein